MTPRARVLAIALLFAGGCRSTLDLAEGAADCGNDHGGTDRAPDGGGSPDGAQAGSDGGIDGGGIDAGPPLRFGAPLVVASGQQAATTVGAGDLDGDGVVDLVAGGTPGATWIRGLGGGAFAAPTTLVSNPLIPIRDLAVGDADGDHRADAAVITDTQLGLFRYRSSGFVTSWSNPGGVTSHCLVLADATGDGAADAWLTDWQLQALTVLTLQPDGTFLPARRFSFTASPGPVAVSDFNGDGVPDAVVGFEAQLEWILSSQSGYLPVTDLTVNPWSNHALAVADFDGDRRPDLLTANYFGYSPAVEVKLGTGASPVVLAERPSITSAAAGDLNGDGAPDVVFGSEQLNDAAAVEIIRGNGHGRFDLPLVVPLPQYASASQILVTDVTGDGAADVVVAAAADGSILIFPAAP